MTCQFYRAMRMHKRGICCHSVSVTFVNCAKTNKDIFETLPSGSQAVHKHGHLSVIVAYAPTQPSADADKDTFLPTTGLPNISNTST